MASTPSDPALHLATFSIRAYFRLPLFSAVTQPDASVTEIRDERRLRLTGDDTIPRSFRGSFSPRLASMLTTDPLEKCQRPSSVSRNGNLLNDRIRRRREASGPVETTRWRICDGSIRQHGGPVRSYRKSSGRVDGKRREETAEWKNPAGRG